MSKFKIHSGTKKRLSLIKSGKVKRVHANKCHLLNGHDKDIKRKRGPHAGTYADKTSKPVIKRMTPYKQDKIDSALTQEALYNGQDQRRDDDAQEKR